MLVDLYSLEMSFHEEFEYVIILMIQESSEKIYRYIGIWHREG